MSHIAQKAGIRPGDSPEIQAQKVRHWIEESAPDLTDDQLKKQFELAWNGIHATDGRRELVGKSARFGWGGARPNTGGARPNSGPLKSRVQNFHPFAHGEKGGTISKVSWEFTRCNACGAIGWKMAEDEHVWDASLPEGEGWQDVEGLAGQAIVHNDGCANR